MRKEQISEFRGSVIAGGVESMREYDEKMKYIRDYEISTGLRGEEASHEGLTPSSRHSNGAREAKIAQQR